MEIRMLQGDAHDESTNEHHYRSLHVVEAYFIGSRIWRIVVSVIENDYKKEVQLTLQYQKGEITQ